MEIMTEMQHQAYEICLYVKNEEEYYKPYIWLEGRIKHYANKGKYNEEKALNAIYKLVSVVARDLAKKDIMQISTNAKKMASENLLEEIKKEHNIKEEQQ